MSSSISSSDAAGWRSLALTLVATTLLAFGAVVGIGIAVDPYDTGRFALLNVRGVPEQQQRTANASRGRDPAFDAAVIGNSHTQLLQPDRLNALSGARFVSLSTPGTLPREQAVMLRYYLRHRSAPPRVIVIGTDNTWCADAVGLPLLYPFPFWLYAESPREYLSGLVGWEILDAISRRVAYALGRAERARPDGYWDYAVTLEGQNGRATIGQTIGDRPVNTTGRFPAVDLLRELLAEIPPETAVVLVRPPVFATALPPPGTPAAAADAGCRAALAVAAQSRPRTAMVDWLVDRPEVRDPQNFYDHTHYGQALARLVEADIGAALQRLR
jgi:hypothetical protein